MALGARPETKRTSPPCMTMVEPRIGPEQPFLSVIVPAYNEQARISASLAKLAGYLSRQSYSWEVVVVDDGSSDATAAIVREWTARHPGFRLEAISHAGKGAAVRHGMLSARGAQRFMCDADLAMPPEYLDAFTGTIGRGWDIAIASRQMAGARRVGESRLRYFLSRLFNRLVRLLVVREFSDTQCGFKCFSAGAAEVLFSRQRTTGWSFDVELLYLARELNMRVAEIPIACHHDRTGVVRALSMALAMLWGITVLKWRSIGRRRLSGDGTC